MTKAKAEDMRWIASGLDDFAVLLRAHGIDDLAGQLDAVRIALPESNAFAADRAGDRRTSRRNSGCAEGRRSDQAADSFMGWGIRVRR
jgi:hypothetical protein